MPEKCPKFLVNSPKHQYDMIHILDDEEEVDEKSDPPIQGETSKLSSIPYMIFHMRSLILIKLTGGGTLESAEMGRPSRIDLAKGLLSLELQRNAAISSCRQFLTISKPLRMLR